MSATSVSTDSKLIAVENRAFPRRRAWGSATLVPADKPLAPTVRVTLVNISQGGIQFLVAKELQLLQRFVMEIQLSLSNTHPDRRLIEVRWIKPDSKPGHFRVGCAWIDRLNYSDLLRFS